MMLADEVSVCAACGYPTLGPDVCYFCRPLVATALSIPRLSGRADEHTSVSSMVASTFAAAG